MWCVCAGSRARPGGHRLHWQDITQVSKGTFSKSTVACLRKIFHNMRKILAFECKTVKITSSNLILLILTKYFYVLWPFRHIFMRDCFWPDILPGQWQSLLESVSQGRHRSECANQSTAGFYQILSYKISNRKYGPSISIPNVEISQTTLKRSAKNMYIKYMFKLNSLALPNKAPVLNIWHRKF